MARKSIPPPDRDSQGRRVVWDIELWEFKNYLKIDVEYSYQFFHRKSEAIEFIQERLTQGLVKRYEVTRRRFNSDLTLFDKIKMQEYETNT